jgi:hypothetical protein
MAVMLNVVMMIVVTLSVVMLNVIILRSSWSVSLYSLSLCSVSLCSESLCSVSLCSVSLCSVSLCSVSFMLYVIILSVVMLSVVIVIVVAPRKEGHQIRCKLVNLGQVKTDQICTWSCHVSRSPQSQVRPRSQLSPPKNFPTFQSVLIHHFGVEGVKKLKIFLSINKKNF